MEDFVHLHVHTYYSILDGQASIPKLVDKALADGMRGMAITDHGNMMGIKEFFNYCKNVNKKRKKEGKEPFKPIIGCEVYVVRNNRSLTDRDKSKGDIGGNHLILLAKNLKGYHNLIKIVSKAWTEGFYSRPRTDHNEIEKYHEGLIVCSACIAGEVPEKILEDNIDGAEESILWFKRIFKDDYYLEIQRHEVKDANIHANRETFPEQQKANKIIIELAKKHNVKIVCTNDSHFVDKEDAEAHDRLLCLSTGKDLNDPSRLLYTKQEWFKTKSEMYEVFSDIPEALNNTCEVLNKVEEFSIDHDPIMPIFPIPEDFGNEKDYKNKITKQELYDEFTCDENGNAPQTREEGEEKIKKLGGYDSLYRIKLEADYLKKLAYDGAKKLYGNPIPKEIINRLEYELHIMKTMGFPGYFLIVQDFINVARQKLDVMVGPGRGSAAGSVVAYCLGITLIDPIKYNLLFERFLNPDRISLPDIDTDFDDDGRSKVLDYVKDKYGREKVAHIITYGTMATKNSIRDVARVERLPLERSNQLCKAIPDKLPNGLKLTLANAISVIPELKAAENSTNQLESETIRYAKMLEGTVRSTGIHACGTIICRDNINDWVPVATAEDKNEPGKKLLCTQYDGHVIEETGLIKMDFLGLKTLSQIKEVIENVRLTRGIEIDIENVPLDDPLTYKLFCEGRTIGTFQFESPKMQKYLRDLQPTVFEDLIAMNALYRPGPMDNIPEFIARKKNPSRVKYDIPCMEKYLKETYGITVYQEQVMLLSRQLANFTRGESDALRKAMGKKKKDIVDSMKPKFLSEGMKNGHDKATLEKIWGDWEKFASYAFNKSHATCYSRIAFQTAYLKAHFPAEFMAGIMSRSLDDMPTVTKFMDEAKAMGIPILGPDINESRQKFSVNTKGKIRFGMSAIKGVGSSLADTIIKERDKKGPFKDIFDFVRRLSSTNVNRKCLESFVYSGAFDSFKNIKREDFFAENNKGVVFIDTLLKYGQSFKAEQNQVTQSLFGGMDDVEMPTPTIPKGESWSDIERLNKEREYVGIYISAHPLDEYKVLIEHLCNTHCSELSEIQSLDKEDVVIGGIITKIQSKFTKQGKPCGFVTIEDFKGSGELALFGEDWGRWSGMFKEGCVVFITAKCQQRFKNSDLRDLKVLNVEYMQTIKEKAIKSITVSIMADRLDEQIVDDFNEVISATPGNTRLLIKLHDTLNNCHILLHCQKQKIEVNKSLVSFIEEHKDIMEYVIN